MPIFEHFFIYRMLCLLCVYTERKYFFDEFKRRILFKLQYAVEERGRRIFAVRIRILLQNPG